MNESKPTTPGKRSKATHPAMRAVMLALVVSPLAIFYSIYLTDYKTKPVPQAAWVSWYDDPQHAVYVGWETPTEVLCTVRYGIDPATLNLTENEPVSATFHSMNLTNLTADTIYYYQVETPGGVYASGQFRTAPSTQSPFTCVFIADTQPRFGPGWAEHLANVVATKNYSFLAMIGDMVEDGTKDEWNYFHTVGSRYYDTVPLVPVQGNHDRARDLDDDDATPDVYYFASYFPQTADKQIDPHGNNSYDKQKQFYFSFDWGSVHFQVLHFPEVDLDDAGDGGLSRRDYYQAFTPDHLAWLEQDLNRSRTMPFRVSMFHCPITSAGFYGENYVMKEQLLPILHRYNVTATFSGHAHHFERGTLVNQTHYPDSPLTYFVVGTGGGLADVGLRPVPETAICTASPSYTEAAATATTLTFTTYGIDGTVIDTFTVRA
ncbi:MAG: metallophosphoesterase family protein [Candidatus Lokiarchaeota archaeon]|nr:metallophosphoesterase family protein [Candidatus Lokiarchaeota archaeon]